MTQRSAHVFTAVAVSAGVLLGIGILGFGALRLALSPLDRMAGFLHNPLGLVTRTAPTGPVVLQAVQQLNRLETCRYSEQVVVRGDHKGLLPTWLAGDRILFVAQGEVTAGVDLSRLRADDVQARGDAVAIRLPQPQILASSLDNRRSRVYDRQAGILTGPDPQLETQVRQEAEDRVREAALESGVLRTAGANAQDALRRQLTMLGFRQVSFL